MKWTIPSLLVPQEALLPLLVLAGILTIVGLTRVAGGLVLFVLAMAFAPMFEPVVEALVAALPDWALVLLLAGLGLAVLRAVIALVLGKGVADAFFGTLLANLVVGLVLLPFRTFRSVLRFLINGGN